MKNRKYIVCIETIISLLILITIEKHNHFYHDIKEIEDPDDLLVLVNKNHKLDENYVPEDLELLNITYSYENKYLRNVAKEHFEKLSRDSSLLGYKIIVTSAYRDYEYQSKLYEYYVETNGLDYADKCSARPGHSEHQTGLAIDVMGSNNDYNEFESSHEFSWMKENAHKYGFILRYPKGKEDITGFKYEPWHYRYVGVKISTIIYEQNITFEEYIKLYNLNRD